MKKLSLILSLCILFNSNLLSSDIDTPPEALLYQYLETPNKKDSLQLLNSIINNKKNKKWPRLPYIIFLKAEYFFTHDKKELALEELKYLIKKHPVYIEPWLELLYYYSSENKMNEGYSFSRKAPLKARISISELSPFRNKQPYPQTEYLKKLLFFFNILFEYDKQKERRIIKAHKRFNEYIRDNNINVPDDDNFPHLTLSDNFFNIFIFFQKGNIPEARKLIKRVLSNNWKEEECVFHLLLINIIKPFQDFFIKEKERNAYEIWKIIWNESRRNWQKNRWTELFNKYKNNFLTFNTNTISNQQDS